MGFTRIDVHAHFLPDFYNDALVEAGQTHPDGMPAIPKWSQEAAFAMMDKLQIKAAVLSISSPGVHFGDDLKAKQLARRVNEEGTRLRQAHPGRFGLFALTPLPPWPKACEREQAGKITVPQLAGPRLRSDEPGAQPCCRAKLTPQK